MRGIKRWWVPIVSCLLMNAARVQAAEPIKVFPETTFDDFIIYESLAIFWLAILCLIVIIRMKLREIERTQEMGAEQEDKDAPLLR
jgi:hypothetical protein